MPNFRGLHSLKTFRIAVKAAFVLMTLGYQHVFKGLNQ